VHIAVNYFTWMNAVFHVPYFWMTHKRCSFFRLQQCIICESYAYRVVIVSVREHKNMGSSAQSGGAHLPLPYRPWTGRIARWSYLKKTPPGHRDAECVEGGRNRERYFHLQRTKRSRGSEPKTKTILVHFYPKNCLWWIEFFLNVAKCCHWASSVALKWIPDKMSDFHLPDFKWKCRAGLHQNTGLLATPWMR